MIWFYVIYDPFKPRKHYMQSLRVSLTLKVKMIHNYMRQSVVFEYNIYIYGKHGNINDTMYSNASSNVIMIFNQINCCLPCYNAYKQ